MPIMDYGTSFLRRLWYFFDNSSIHGFRYFSTRSGWLTRIFWLAVCVLSAWCMNYLFNSAYEIYRSEAISFMVDTSYLYWNTTFPAVVLCLRLHKFLTFEESVKFFNYGSLKNANKYCRRNPCKAENLQQLRIESYISNASEIIDQVEWNSHKLNVDEHFLPLMTSRGKCFAFNSLHNSKSMHSRNYVINRISGPGTLQFNLRNETQMNVIVIPPEDTVNLKTLDSQQLEVNNGVLQGSADTLLYLFSIVEMYNEPEVFGLDIQERLCRFPWEVPGDMEGFGPYSHSTCITKCMALFDIAMCNCTVHHLPPRFGNNNCDVHGLNCLSDISAYQYEENINQTGVVCKCVPSCTEPTYAQLNEQNQLFYATAKLNKRTRPLKIVVKMNHLPSERNVRKVAISRLDFVVTIGGTAGLFFGASVLSLIEIIYLCLRRRQHIDDATD